MKLLIFYLFLLTGVNARFTCRNHENQEVSWFIIFYIPQIDGGLKYFYYDSRLSEAGEPMLKLIDEININDDNTRIANTLNQFYNLRKSQQSNVLQILYNDKPADRPPGKGGHMKGALYFLGDSGFYFVHSAPGFILPEYYSFPDSALKNGQNYFCSSIKNNALNPISHHLYITDPMLYRLHVLNSFMQHNRWLKKVFLNQFQKPPFVKRSYSFKIAGTDINVDLFSKAEKPYEHLWLEVLEEYPGQTFDITSWCGEKTRCRNPRLNNIMFNFAMVDGEESICWAQANDHSKWSIGITEDSQNLQAPQQPIVCISDLNHADKQEKRSGGIYCLKEENLFNAIRSTFRFVLQE